jgi:hypothetical protein
MLALRVALAAAALAFFWCALILGASEMLRPAPEASVMKVNAYSVIHGKRIERVAGPPAMEPSKDRNL